jgi:predicted Mrr-cat superfamily restriction endonuclease
MPPTNDDAVSSSDLSELAHDQIVSHIQSHFAGHALAGLVEAVLKVDGWVTIHHKDLTAVLISLPGAVHLG